MTRVGIAAAPDSTTRSCPCSVSAFGTFRFSYFLFSVVVLGRFTDFPFPTLCARGADSRVSRDGSLYIQHNVQDLDLHRLLLCRHAPLIRHLYLQPSMTPSRRQNGRDFKKALARANAGAVQVPSTRLRNHSRSPRLPWLTLPLLLLYVAIDGDNTSPSKLHTSGDLTTTWPCFQT
jgi:hypothetical protein